MSFILDTMNRIEDPAEVRERYRLYYAYLEEVKARLPQAAYEFAVADWHYNSRDYRCPHDGQLETACLREIDPPDGTEDPRRIDLAVRLRNASQRIAPGYIDLLYKGVYSYNMSKPAHSQFMYQDNGHYDWLIDEIRLSEHQLVEHEIEFFSGARWMIECEDVICRWSPLE